MSTSHQPKKSLGQNFLHERVYIERIVQAVDPKPGDRLVEIGPGQARSPCRCCAATAR